MSEKMTLAELAAKYQTDKQISDHNYVAMYERMLKTIKVDSLLEVGLGNGASMRMWMDYFPNAKSYCIEYFDEENKTLWHGADGKNIAGLTVFAGDSTVAETWENVPSNLDFIVDDGLDSDLDSVDVGGEKLDGS